MRKQLTERGRGTATVQESTTTGSRYRVRLIEGPRWGSSGYYTREALDSAPAVFGGAKVYLDHPGAQEDKDRPERSLRDLVGHIDQSVTREADGVWSALNVLPHMKELVESLASNGDLDMSIRAVAEATPGEVDGRTGYLIKRFLGAYSVDLVTEAGAGGRVFELIESARNHTPVQEAATNDRRDQLQRVLRVTPVAAAMSSRDEPDSWSYLEDFDEDQSLVWFMNQGRYWEQSFSVAEDDMSIALEGEPTEVRPITTYHPVTSTGPNPLKEAAMPTIDEARLAELTEAANRVSVLEAERDEALQRAEAAESQARQSALGAYETTVSAALSESTLPALAQERVRRDLTLAEGADIPADAATLIEARINEEKTYLDKVTESTKRPLGFGAAGKPELIESYTNPWGRTINTKGA